MITKEHLYAIAEELARDDLCPETKKIFQELYDEIQTRLIKEKQRKELAISRELWEKNNEKK